MSQHDSEAGSAFSPVAAASSAASSGMVMSAFSATCAKRNDRCGSSLAWRRPPLGLGSKLPRERTALTRFTTKETDTLKCAAAPAPRMTIFDKADNPLTQIKRIGLWHRVSPPNRSKSRITSHWNPSQFNVTVRRSSRLLKRSLRLRNRGGRGDFLWLGGAHFEVLAGDRIIVLWLFMLRDALRPSGP